MEHLLSVITQSNPLLQGLFVLLSVAGLWYGSEKAIWGVKNIARKFNVPEMLIGLSIVSIGSSFPEIFVNISAGLREADDVGVGNIVGSCFVQISAILGICVLVGGVMTEQRKKLKRDAPVLLGSIGLLFLFGLNGEISTLEGLLLISGYIAYLIYLFTSAIHRHKDPERRSAQSKLPFWILGFVFGIFLVWISAEVLIGIGITAGEKIGLSNGVIGLLSGIGTSIPELSISLMALLRKSHGISVGNLLGSNITDPLFSLGIGAALAGGYSVSPFLLWTAIPLWFMASFSAVAIFWFFGKITRGSACVLIAFYLGTFFYFFI